MTLISTARPGKIPEPASVSYDGIPWEPRVWVVRGMFAIGEVTIFAGPGKSAKGLSIAGYVARIVLGLARPGEDPQTRHAPARALWIAGGAEDDPIHDLSARFTAAIRQAAADFGLDPDQALADGLKYIHDLSGWDEAGTPVEVPQDCDALEAEVLALNELDAGNQPREPGTPFCPPPGPPVQLVIMDPLKSMLGPRYNLTAGARKVITPLNRFAKNAQVAVAAVVHVTKTGSIQGSTDVTNAVRLAFTVRKGENGMPSAITLYASNIATPEDVLFLVTGDEPDTHVVFLPPEQVRPDARQERQRSTTARGLRQRIELIREHARKPAREAAQTAADLIARDGLVASLLSVNCPLCGAIIGASCNERLADVPFVMLDKSPFLVAHLPRIQTAIETGAVSKDTVLAQFPGTAEPALTVPTAEAEAEEAAREPITPLTV
jgi:AAA domain